MSIHKLSKSYDVIVVGGGLAGVCAAIASARTGAQTAIVQNRPMFGGNASSEVKMHIVGASAHGSKKNLAETGIIEEILLENKKRNPISSFSVFDSVLWEKIAYQNNLSFFLNTNVDDVYMNGSRISSICCHQATTETELILSASVFVDATGHGTLGVMSGASYRSGSESKHEFHEPSAPESSNQYHMGSSLMFIAKKCNEPVAFEKPFWAYSFSEDDLRFRPHSNGITSHADGGEIINAVSDGTRLPGFSSNDSGYWWIELGGQYADNIAAGETIRDELLKCVYGVWDHLKNQGNHGLSHYALEWVGMVPGYRESRRLEGDYILTENDIRSNKIFDDAVSYGGWAMDVHIPNGLFDYNSYPSKVYNFTGCYSIPYRCYYSKNIDNLMMAGRNISCSKMAFSSTRVMGTCAVGGQAVGTAAALSIQHNCSPKEIGMHHIRELQQLLLKDDCFIPGFSNQDPLDLARKCKVVANGFQPFCPPENIINGYSRSIDSATNCWESARLDNKNASISLLLPHAFRLQQVRITFDPDLSSEIMPSITPIVRDRQPKGMPPRLVRNYTICLYYNGSIVKKIEIINNCQRLNIHKIENILCDKISVEISATYGYPYARIYELRLY